MKPLGQIAYDCYCEKVTVEPNRILWDYTPKDQQELWEQIAKAVAEEAIKDFISRMPRLVPQYRESETPPSGPFTPSDIFVLAGFCIGLAQRDLINLNDYERSTLRRAGEALRLTALSLKK